MSKKITILGIDPALANTGIAVMRFNLETSELELDALSLLETAPSKDGKKVRKSSDDLDRMLTLHAGVQGAISMFSPAFVVAEVPSGTQSARASFSNGGCCMMLAAVQYVVPLIQVSPTEVKVASVGHKHAAKEEMIEWAVGKYPAAQWLTVKRKGQMELVAKNEHLADAVAAVHAGIKTQQFLSAAAVLRSIRAAA